MLKSKIFIFSIILVVCSVIAIVVMNQSSTSEKTTKDIKNTEPLEESQDFEEFVTILSEQEDSSEETDGHEIVAKLAANGAQKEVYYSPDEVFLLLEAYHQALQKNVNTAPPKMEDTVEAVSETLQSTSLNSAQKIFLEKYYAVVQVMDEKMGKEKSWEERQSTYKEISVYGEEMKKLKKKYKSSIGEVDLFTSYEYNRLFAAS